MSRIGVFVCHCGENIARTVDCAKVAETLKDHPGVAIAEDYKYMCSDPGQALVKQGDRGEQPHRRRHRRLLAAHAREDLPPRRRPGRPQQVHVRDGQHPRALLLDPRGQGRGDRQGHRHRPHDHREGQAQPAARDDQDPGHQARPGHRRRHRRHPGGARHRRRRPRGHPRREGSLHRRPHEPAERDVPHARLLAVHPHPAHGRGVPAPQHQAPHVERGGEGRRLHRQLRGHGAQEGARA